ncbi:MAG: acetyl-CoA hydrolase [Halieaceae bacterium]|jgi:acyl-CoA hydrolase|uniref:acetyl-CoA hydrolase/transferase C-terminal domain-containing protein n=1 Tax=Haliea alexandrii TaxID=2448162 RepID=UPI000F0B5AF3|nr:acetyl-CoA hydrolase/transferase C-terminal domain-containing protein [Haliea alexandrii]MCR9186042.1 acetyl-CoA hydrolase [Halieaceae bacterium]
MTERFATAEACVDYTIARLGKTLRLGAPLGLGKPVQLMNAFFRRAEQDPEIDLHIYTALSLEVPKPASHIEAELAGPIVERIFGDYEPLAYMEAQRSGNLPNNIQVSELYFKAGSMKGIPAAQQQYISSNYTHIARDMMAAGVNVLLQLVAARETADGLALSLSCNPDVALDVIHTKRAEQGEDFLCFAQVHDDLPFMRNDAEVPATLFDGLIDNPAYQRTLFAVPNASVPTADYATALHASSLVVDGGTLQIGIGSLGDAVAHALILRHQQPAAWRDAVDRLTRIDSGCETDEGPFEQGLYVSTEMFVNGMLHLMEAGVVKRRVYDLLTLQRGLNDGLITEAVDERLLGYARQSALLPAQLDADSLAALQYWGILPDTLCLIDGALSLDGVALANNTDDPDTRTALLQASEGRQLRHGRVLHGGFFLGPRDFYQKLRDLDDDGQERICMTSVLRTNQLLLDYPLYCAQRQHARFINTGMMVSLSGAVTSDALEDGTVISGVGGQYNFVAMAHDLPGARSVLCIRSTRGKGKALRSNVVTHYGHTTIPRHLRDIIVTEYGIADLRGQTDAEVIRRLIAIADSRFQQELANWAIEHGKLPADYEIPAAARNNTPYRVAKALSSHIADGRLPAYPFGTDLTPEELTLSASLRRIKALSDEPASFLREVLRALLHRGDKEAARPWLERIHLMHPDSSRDFIVQQLLMLELEEHGLLKVR